MAMNIQRKTSKRRSLFSDDFNSIPRNRGQLAQRVHCRAFCSEFLHWGKIAISRNTVEVV